MELNFSNFSLLQIHRVRLNGAADGLRARLRFEAALADVSSAALGLPPRVLLMVKHIAPSARLSIDRVRVNDRFQQAVCHELQQKAKLAVRPWLTVDTNNAEAVLFADEAELMACLLRDSLRGISAGQWWRQLVLGDLLVSAWWRRAVLPRGELLPVVVSQLATEKLAIPWLACLQDSDITLATQAIATAYRIDTSSIICQQTITRSTLSSDTPAHAHIAYQQLIQLIPELLTSTLTIPQQRLLALSLGLQRALTWTRSPEFLLAMQTLEAQYAPAVLSNQTATSQQTIASVTESEPTVNNNAEPSKTATLLKQAEFSEYPEASFLAADSSQNELVAVTEQTTEPLTQAHSNRTVAVSKAWTVSESDENNVPQYVTAIKLREDTSSYAAWIHARLPALHPSGKCKPVPDRFVPQSRSQGGQYVHATGFQPPCWNDDAVGRYAHSATSTSVSSDEIAPLFLHSITTEFGGIFYLLNVALALELYGDFTQPRTPGIALSPWDWLALLGRAWFGSAFVQDPLWSLLAKLSGRTHGLGNDFSPPDSWLMPVDWLLPWGAVDVLFVYVQRDRLQVWHPANFIIIDIARDKTLNPLNQARQLCSHYECLNQARLVRVSRLPLIYNIARCGKLKHWLHCLLLYLHARLQHALGDAESTLLVKNVCCHTATVYCTASAVDVHLSLATLPIELRIAGLDRDPGWIPASGRTIAFHFQ